MDIRFSKLYFNSYEIRGDEKEINLGASFNKEIHNLFNDDDEYVNEWPISLNIFTKNGEILDIVISNRDKEIDVTEEEYEYVKKYIIDNKHNII